MTENIIIPEKYYVGYVNRKDETGTLGFLTPYGTDSAAKKRISTVDGWRDKNIPSSTVDNALLSGYKIAKHIHRTHYWGGGNVVWRIVDPRGFEFEIESSNMSKILQCTDIIGSEIQGKCILGRSNKGINILLPENSEPYENAIKSTKVFNTSTKNSDLVPGSIIQLKNSSKMVYLGKYYPLMSETTQNNNYYAEPKTHFKESRLKCDKAYYFCYEYKDDVLSRDKILVYSDLKVSSVLGSHYTPEQAKMQVLNKNVHDLVGNYKDKTIVHVFESKFTPIIEFIEDTDNEIILHKTFYSNENQTPSDYKTEHTSVINYNGHYYTKTQYKSDKFVNGFKLIEKYTPTESYVYVRTGQHLSYRIDYNKNKIIATVPATNSHTRFGGVNKPPLLEASDLYGPNIKWYKMIVKDIDGNIKLNRLTWNIS